MSLAPLLLLAAFAHAGDPSFDPSMSVVAPFTATGRSGAAAAAPLQTTSKAAIEGFVKEHIDAGRFDRLTMQRLVIDDGLVSEFDFFQAHVQGYLKDWDKRVYVLKVNPRLYADSPGDTALRAILAHELTHLNEFAHSSTFGLAGIGWDYAFSDDNADVVAWERATDENALRLGFAEGLKQYRTWLYAHLTPERAQKKRRIYYTPEQIDAWTAARR